jgi:sugar phosphate permease
VWLGVILCCTVLVAYLDRVNVSVLIAAPGFLQEMGLKNNPVGQGLLMSLFLMAYGIGNVVLGPVADRLGPRKAMSVALFSWTIPMAAGALTRTLSVLYASRLVLGAGEAMHYPMQSSFVKNWYPREERAKANAAWLFGQMIGPGLAMPLFAWVIAAFGWRASFWLCAFLGMVILPVIWFGTRDLPEQHKGVNQAELEHILQGRALTAEGTGKTMQARSVLQNYGILLKNPDFICCSLTYWASNTMWWGMMSWMPQYLKVARGFSWTKMGFFSALPFFVGLLGLISSGVVSDKLRRAAPLNCIGLAGCATFIGLGAIVHNNNLSAYLLACAFFFKGVSTPMAWTLLQTFVPSRMIGQAAGLQNGSSNLIGALSPLAVGFLIAVTGTYTAGLFYMVGFGLFGAAVGLYLVAKKY